MLFIKLTGGHFLQGEFFFKFASFGFLEHTLFSKLRERVFVEQVKYQRWAE